MLPLNEGVTLTSEEKENLKNQYKKSMEEMKNIKDFSIGMVYLTLLRITTLEIVILVFTCLSIIIIISGSKNKSMCLLCLGFLFSIFWVVFFIFKMIKNFVYIADPKFNTVFLVWMLIIDFFSIFIFLILANMSIKGLFIIPFLVYCEERNIKDDENNPLIRDEELPKRDFGTLQN